MSQVNEVKGAVDIVEIIGERVNLTRSGANLKGLCPFHSEKSPSFFVSETMQRFRCFGCGETGDVFSFLQKYEGMTFVESLRQLAERAGIELKEFAVSPQDELRDRVLAVLDVAADYYHYLLTTHPVGQAARDYLKQRGVTNDSIRLFKLGYSLSGWDGVIKYLHHKKKIALADIEQAGLIIKGKTGRYYDRFRGRIIFPLTNPRGQVVGFSGRVLQADVKEAKYINSPETMVYHKSELLFGYSQLYQAIRQAESVIVAEGELDVISSVQAHVSNIVAIKGSALTTEQLRQLSRTVKKVLLSLDMDAAGVAATKRAINLARDFELELRIIQLPGGKDPDELASKQPKIWRQATQAAMSVYQFLVDRACQQFDPSTPEGKRQIIDELAPVLGEISHAVEQDYYLKALADRLAVSVELVRQDIERFRKAKKLGRPTNQAAISSSVPTPQSQLERYVLALALRLFESNVAACDQWLKKLKPYQQQLSSTTNFLLEHLTTKLGRPLQDLTGQLAEDYQQLLTDVYLDPMLISALDATDLNSELAQVEAKLQAQLISDQITTISRELDQLDAKQEKTPAEESRQAELLRQVVSLKRKQQTN